MSRKSKIIAGLAAIVIVGGTIIGISIANDQNKQETKPAQVVQKNDSLLQVNYRGEVGKNALELLKKNYTVETKTYEGLGEMVTSINGVKPDSKHFWAFYVNGSQAQVGADQYVTKSGDTITWKLDAIQ